MHLFIRASVRMFVIAAAIAAPFVFAAPLSAAPVLSATPLSAHPSTYDNLTHYTGQEPYAYPKAKAAGYGVGTLYAVASPEKYGVGDGGLQLVGTFGKNCLVTVGYPYEYYEYGPPKNVKRFVQVFDRYGSTDFYDDGQFTLAQVKPFLARNARHCA